MKLRSVTTVGGAAQAHLSVAHSEASYSSLPPVFNVSTPVVDFSSEVLDWSEGILGSHDRHVFPVNHPCIGVLFPRSVNISQ
jgi:hypothetical protein